MTLKPGLQNGITIGALFALLVLLGMNFWMLQVPVNISPARMTPGGTDTARSAPASGTESSAGPLEITETIARPLFSPTGREFVPQVLAAEPAPVEPQIIEADPVPVPRPALIFQGTSRIGGRSAALIAYEDGSNANWLTTGQDIMGWKIEAIEPDRLVISLSSQRVVYDLYPMAGNDGQQ